MPRPNLPPQILRLVLLTLVIVATYVVARRLLTPPTFGQYGHYRAAALEENAGREPKFAGAKACGECHSDTEAALALDKHRTISCESCHGAARQHARNPDIVPAKFPDGFCLRCHLADAARPAHQRQIVPQDHHHEDRCTECHFPHQPNKSP